MNVRGTWLHRIVIFSSLAKQIFEYDSLKLEALYTFLKLVYPPSSAYSFFLYDFNSSFFFLLRPSFYDSWLQTIFMQYMYEPTKSLLYISSRPFDFWPTFPLAPLSINSSFNSQFFRFLIHFQLNILPHNTSLNCWVPQLFFGGSVVQLSLQHNTTL